MARPAVPHAGLHGSPVFTRAAPFAVFILFVALQPLLAPHVDARWLAVARGLAAGALLLFFWRGYTELHAGSTRYIFRDNAPATLRAVGLAIGVGVAVFAAWIHLDSGWVAFDMGRGFVPTRADGSLDTTMVALRVAGFVLVVPVMEELFWRSLAMRWIDSRDFLAVDPRRASFVAFALSSALFALEHSQWLAGLLAGAAYGWLYLRSGNLWIPIISHATTNGILALWIVATGSWRFW
jgi:CAAX prenyl protease-like protein